MGLADNWGDLFPYKPSICRAKVSAQISVNDHSWVIRNLGEAVGLRVKAFSARSGSVVPVNRASDRRSQGELKIERGVERPNAARCFVRDVLNWVGRRYGGGDEHYGRNGTFRRQLFKRRQCNACTAGVSNNADRPAWVLGL